MGHVASLPFLFFPSITSHIRHQSFISLSVSPPFASSLVPFVTRAVREGTEGSIASEGQSGKHEGGMGRGRGATFIHFFHHFGLFHSLRGPYPSLSLLPLSSVSSGDWGRVKGPKGPCPQSPRRKGRRVGGVARSSLPSASLEPQVKSGDDRECKP